MCIYVDVGNTFDHVLYDISTVQEHLLSKLNIFCDDPIIFDFLTHTNNNNAQ